MKYMFSRSCLAIFGLSCLLILCDCSSDDGQTIVDLPDLPTSPYGTLDGKIVREGVPVQLNGVNTLQTFGLGNTDLMNSWNIEIVREFIGNLREQPIEGTPMQGSDGVWLHPLTTIVEQHQASGRVTILCPFGWVDENGNQQLLTGLNPAEQIFYDAYKERMKAMAQAFKGQNDVWIEVWNEPYHWNNERGYSHNLWLSNMQDMVDNLREIDGFENIIVVPGNEQGQSEAAILAEGANLLTGRHNVVFDLHAYEKWLLNHTANDIVSRIETIQDQNLPILFGEVGVVNVSGLMEVSSFLDAMNETQTSTMAWLWNQNTEDQNSLLTDDGAPNDTNNLNWGSMYQQFLGQ